MNTGMKNEIFKKLWSGIVIDEIVVQVDLFR